MFSATCVDCGIDLPIDVGTIAIANLIARAIVLVTWAVPFPIQLERDEQIYRPMWVLLERADEAIRCALGDDMVHGVSYAYFGCTPIASTRAAAVWIWSWTSSALRWAISSPFDAQPSLPHCGQSSRLSLNFFPHMQFHIRNLRLAFPPEFKRFVILFPANVAGKTIHPLRRKPGSFHGP